MKKFYEYCDYSGYPVINEMVYASTAMAEEYHHCFLIYAENKENAIILASKHIFEGYPLTTIYGVQYNNEIYSEIKNVLV